jgi:hypothetical protein
MLPLWLGDVLASDAGVSMLLMGSASPQAWEAGCLSDNSSSFLHSSQNTSIECRPHPHVFSGRSHPALAKSNKTGYFPSPAFPSPSAWPGSTKLVQNRLFDSCWILYQEINGGCERLGDSDGVETAFSVELGARVAE